VQRQIRTVAERNGGWSVSAYGRVGVSAWIAVPDPDLLRGCNFYGAHDSNTPTLRSAGFEDEDEDEDDDENEAAKALFG